MLTIINTRQLIINNKMNLRQATVFSTIAAIVAGGKQHTIEQDGKTFHFLPKCLVLEANPLVCNTTIAIYASIKDLVDLGALIPAQGKFEYYAINSEILKNAIPNTPQNKSFVFLLKMNQSMLAADNLRLLDSAVLSAFLDTYCWYGTEKVKDGVTYKRLSPMVINDQIQFCGVEEQTVRHALDRLKKAGYIKTLAPRSGFYAPTKKAVDSIAECKKQAIPYVEKTQRKTKKWLANAQNYVPKTQDSATTKVEISTENTANTENKACEFNTNKLCLACVFNTKLGYLACEKVTTINNFKIKNNSKSNNNYNSSRAGESISDGFDSNSNQASNTTKATIQSTPAKHKNKQSPNPKKVSQKKGTVATLEGLKAYLHAVGLIASETMQLAKEHIVRGLLKKYNTPAALYYANVATLMRDAQAKWSEDALSNVTLATFTPAPDVMYDKIESIICNEYDECCFSDASAYC